MDIIIVGCGKVGRAIAQQLNAEDHNIVVVDNKPSVLNEISETLDIMTVEGNGIKLSVLQEAEAKNADLLIAVTNADEINLLCCLIASKCGTKHTIARVRNPEYNHGIDLIKDDLGLSMTINPEFIAAKEMSRLVRFPSAIEIDTFAKGVVELFKIKVPSGSALDGLSLKDSALLSKHSLRVCGVERGDEVFIPGGDFVLMGGDKVTMIAPPKMIAKFSRKIGIITGKSRNIILIGGGRIAYYLAKQLIPTGAQVKIIERNPERCQFLSEELEGAVIIQGDGMNQELLLEEGIENADVVASLTDFDEENIMLSLYVGSVSDCKVITKINRVAFEDIIESLNLGSVIHPKFLTAEYIVTYVRAMQNSFGSNVETLYSILGGNAEALEFRVREKSSIVGVPLMNLKFKSNLQLACINRNGNIIIPTGNDTIEVGDTVIVVTTHTGLKDIKDILS